MIAKGHDSTTDAGLRISVDARLGMRFPRLRENIQFAGPGRGRARRAKTGTVIIQSYIPKITRRIRARANSQKFYDYEINFRRNIITPFVALINALVKHQDFAKRPSRHQSWLGC